MFRIPIVDEQKVRQVMRQIYASYETVGAVPKGTFTTPEPEDLDMNWPVEKSERCNCDLCVGERESEAEDETV